MWQRGLYNDYDDSLICMNQLVYVSFPYLSHLVVGITMSKLEHWGRFHQHFMHSFYMHRSRKAQKKTDSLTVFFALLGAACVKTARPMLVKSNHGIEMGILLLMKERRDLIDLIRSLLHKLQNIFSAPVKLSGLWKKSIKNMSVLL